MNHEHQTAFNIFTQLLVSEVNPNAPGGLEAQIDQLYVNGSAVLAVLAEQAGDPAINDLISLVRNVRGNG